MRAALTDAEQRTEAQRLHLLLVQHLDAYAMARELARLLRQRLRIEHVCRFRHQIAGKENTPRHCVEPLKAAPRRRVLRHLDAEPGELGLIFLLFLGAVFVEAVGAQAGTGGQMRGEGRWFELAAARRLDQGNRGGIVAFGQLGIGVAAGLLGDQVGDGAGLADADHDDAADLLAAGRQHNHTLSLTALEARSAHRSPDGAAQRPV